MRHSPPTKKPVGKRITPVEIFTVIFGLFLGLAIWKFGNPVILDKVVSYPKTWGDFWNDAWPLRWANGLLLVVAVVGVFVALTQKRKGFGVRWLWILPLVWFGWQILSATQSAYLELTTVTLWQYAGCVACYFIGIFAIGPGRRWFVLTGILAAFVFCLIRAVEQRLFEFPNERQFLVESQSAGWTNMPPEMFQELKQDNLIIISNGLDVLNPAIIAKYGDPPPANASPLHLVYHRVLSSKPRVNGTLVYPNALAGIVLLLLPVALVVVWQITRRLRRTTCLLAMGLTIFLGLAGMFWSGSKSGWLIALAAGVFWLYRLKWSRQLKWVVITILLAGGLAVFAVRFQSYFAKGATSVGARFDYWRAAVQTTKEHPVFGTGPGTFQRPYAILKRPESEMARLVHNDYLEQFSDSGIIGGLSYAAWIVLLFWVAGRRIWAAGDWLEFGILTGLLAWFAQGFIEFSLFVPALAWTAFTLAGCLLAQSGNQVDKSKTAD